ncbi:MAG: PD-(D/E)XK nuclease family protein [Candidatus Magasanikbacteria bacterium]|nr:PD-(D/E)XK nuclease family protein [Candidatus Magasanikbacteria bacterium]
MAQDKYTAVWVSHTSMGDFLKCPRAYYLKHVYKDPKTNHKMKIVSPPLALGQAVHEVVESLSILPSDSRMNDSLVVKFGEVWEKVSGKNGGFTDLDTEQVYKERGMEMLRKLMKDPGVLINKAVKIQKDLPWFWLSEEDNIILCGKVDWLEYLPETDSVHIIDFKTGKAQEDPNSLQLPIYLTLVQNCQKRKVEKASYWYLQTNEMVEKELPNAEDAYEKILDIAKRVKLARQLKRFKCPKEGCFVCKPMERILNGEGEFVGNDEYNYDVYILEKEQKKEEKDSIIL